MFEVIRACLVGGAEEDEANGDRDVVLSWSLVRLYPRPLPLSWSLPLPFLFLPLDFPT